MFAVAVDGPSGAGKSTVAKVAARKMKLLYVDTGAIYRTVGLYLLEQDIPRKDEAAVKAALDHIQVELEPTEEGQKMYLNGEDVTGKIRTPQVSMAASDCSSLPVVREYLLNLQRELAQKHNVIMDGRDIGTVVLPQAQLKIFLTASPEERARRRVAQLREAGQAVDYNQTLREIEERDYQDSHRAIAPLKPAPDSILMDTSGQSLEESVEELVSHIQKAAGAGKDFI